MFIVTKIVCDLRVMSPTVILSNKKVINRYNLCNISLPPLNNVPKKGFSLC